jgi:5'-phosphate synthase pdxT subunit
MRALEDVGARPIAVKTKRDLDAIDALIVPGGESTTVVRLLDRFDLAQPIVERVRGGMPFWGTWMGMVVAAHDIAGMDQPTLDLIDITVRRNAFGRQIASAEVLLKIPVLGGDPFPAIFIRAPWIERAGPGVDVLASLDGHGVLVQQRNVLASSFHPELSADRRLHRYFTAMSADHNSAARR